MKYCTKCGKELVDEAVFCVGCGCQVAPIQYTQTWQNNPNNQNWQTERPQQSTVSVALICGIIGIVMAWLFALVGHVMSIIGIVMGVKEYKRTGKMTGLTLSIIGEVCAVLSSLIGMIIMAGL